MRLTDLILSAEMVKFGLNGSDATTAAVRLARAYTSRDLVAVCRDQPFFSPTTGPSCFPEPRLPNSPTRSPAPAPGSR